MKKCKRCCINKSFQDFGNNKNNIDGKSNYCKECERLRGIEYRKKNNDKVRESSKKWRKNNPENYKKTIEKYLEKNPNMKSSERIKLYRKNENFKNKQSERRKVYYKQNLDSIREYTKDYYKKNKKEIREKNNLWKEEKRKSDGFYRMKINLRNRIRDFLKTDLKSKRTKEIVGLDKNNFKSYIESKFTEGMSWENYGQWHIDHIKPLFEANNVEEVLLLNHYTNLQPLWAEDNLKKNRKYDTTIIMDDSSLWTK